METMRPLNLARLAEDPLARELPSQVVKSIETLIQSAQLFGSASGRHAALVECDMRMNALKAARTELYQHLKAALTTRYEAGIELGRQQGVLEHSNE